MQVRKVYGSRTGAGEKGIRQTDKLLEELTVMVRGMTFRKMHDEENTSGTEQVEKEKTNMEACYMDHLRIFRLPTRNVLSHAGYGRRRSECSIRKCGGI